MSPKLVERYLTITGWSHLARCLTPELLLADVKKKIPCDHFFDSTGADWTIFFETILFL